MSIIRPNRIGRRWLGLPISTPRALFNNGESGVILDFTDIRSLFTDASGTTPVTAPDTPIRLAADKSRARSPITAYAGVQANIGQAPRFGRAPKSRRQKLLQSANLTLAPWGATGSYTAVGGQIDPNGGYAAWLISHAAAGQMTQAVTADNSGPVTLKLRVKSGTIGAPTESFLIRNNTTATNLVTATITWATMAVVISGLYGGGVASAPDGGGWVTITITATSGASKGDTLVAYVASAPSATPTTFFLFEPQFENGAVATAFQATTTAFDMAESGYPSFGFARLDTIDDIFATTLTLAQTGDVLLFGRGGSWIEPGRVFGAGAALTIGITGTTITPGILRALGDLVGIVAIGRSLSTDEKTRALRYFQAAGAAGWLVAGVGILPNGGYASGANWTNTSTGSGTAVIGGGVATLTGVDLSNRGKLTADQITGAVIGQAYLITWDVVSGTANAQVSVSSGGVVLDVFGASSVGTKQAVFIAGATTIDCSINVYGAGTVVFDNVAIRPLTVGV